MALRKELLKQKTAEKGLEGAAENTSGVGGNDTQCMKAKSMTHRLLPCRVCSLIP